MPIATPAPQQQVDCDKCDAGYVMDYTIGNIFEAHPSGAKCTKCLSSDCSKCNRLIAEGRFWVKNCQGIDYDIYVPKGCLSKKCGLIFDIHGMSMDANEQKQSSGIIKAVQKYVKSGMAKMAGVSDFATPPAMYSSWVKLSPVEASFDPLDSFESSSTTE